MINRAKAWGAALKRDSDRSERNINLGLLRMLAFRIWCSLFLIRYGGRGEVVAALNQSLLEHPARFLWARIQLKERIFDGKWQELGRRLWQGVSGIRAGDRSVGGCGCDLLPLGIASGGDG
jgi:hypothetical protein